MTNATAQEFTIATPTGQRVLVAIQPSNYASVRDAYEPHGDRSSQYLRLRDRNPNLIAASPDGTWINYRQLYAIANGFVQKLKTPVLAESIANVLFFEGCRPDVAAAFRFVFATYNENDRWWKQMNCTSRFDAGTAMLRPVNPRL